jgi:DNA-binding response OmpR family regulator
MMRILVVDDELVLAEIICEFLQDEGYEADMASGFRSALQFLESERPDLVFLDIMMPDGDGRDIARAIQEDPNLRDIPVIMMSAGVSFQHLQGLIAGFLRKPFDLGELLALVHDTIGPASEPGSEPSP